MTAPGDNLPDEDHALRYIRRRFVDLVDQINGSAFLGRPAEKDNGPSVNWMEFFPGDTPTRIAEIRKVKRMTYERRGRVARLCVGQTREYLRENAALGIDFIYDPLPPDAKSGSPADPSHAYMKGVPVVDSPEGELIQDLFVHCIVESFPVDPG